MFRQMPKHIRTRRSWWNADVRKTVTVGLFAILAVMYLCADRVKAYMYCGERFTGVIGTGQIHAMTSRMVTSPQHLGCSLLVLDYSRQAVVAHGTGVVVKGELRDDVPFALTVAARVRKAGADPMRCVAVVNAGTTEAYHRILKDLRTLQIPVLFHINEEEFCCTVAQTSFQPKMRRDLRWDPVNNRLIVEYYPAGFRAENPKQFAHLIRRLRERGIPAGTVKRTVSFGEGLKRGRLIVEYQLHKAVTTTTVTRNTPTT